MSEREVRQSEGSSFKPAKEAFRLSRRRLILPVGLAIAAIVALACSNGADQNSTQKSLPDRSPELQAFFANLDKQKKQGSPSIQPMSRNVRVIYEGKNIYRAIGTSQRFANNERLVTTVELTLRENECTVLVSFNKFLLVEYATPTNQIQSQEVPNGVSGKSPKKISNCGRNQVDALMNEFISLRP